MGVLSRRPYLDIGIMVLRRTPDGGVIFHSIKELSFERQTSLEVDLDPGSYIILPRTTGCTLRRPPDAKPENIRSIKNGKFHDLVESTIIDIFRKFDMLLNRELSYIEFKAFYECLNKFISEKDFVTQILEKYASTQKGISLRGFIEFWKDALNQYGEVSLFSRSQISESNVNNRRLYGSGLRPWAMIETCTRSARGALFLLCTGEYRSLLR
jgi:calpain-15